MQLFSFNTIFYGFEGEIPLQNLLFQYYKQQNINNNLAKQ